MPRGGKRPGAGGVSSWKRGKTRTIRVPIDLADEIIEIARVLDEGGRIELVSNRFDSDTRSKILDLSGVSIAHFNGEVAVRLEDLVRLGYKIKPDSLAKIIESRIRRKSIK